MEIYSANSDETAPKCWQPLGELGKERECVVFLFCGGRDREFEKFEDRNSEFYDPTGIVPFESTLVIAS